MTYPKNAHKKSPIIKESSKPKVLALLEGKAMTTLELGKLVDRDPETVAKILRDLGEDQAYICDWRGSAHVWTLGKGKHVPRPIGEKPKKVSTSGRHKDAYLLKRPFVTGERIWGI